MIHPNGPAGVGEVPELSNSRLPPPSVSPRLLVTEARAEASDNAHRSREPPPS